MIKFIAIFAVALAAVSVGSHAALAQGAPGGNLLCQILPWLCPTNPGHGGNPGPAPLLAAGIPAFTALGGGVLVSRLYRRFKAR